jgi:hypothetical protein
MDMQSVALSLNSKLSRNRAAAWRYLRGGPGHFLMYVFGRFRVIRSLVVFAYKTRAAKAALLAARTPAVEPLDASQAARAIVKDGYATGLRLKPSILDELQTLSTTVNCFGEEDFKLPFYVEERAAAEQRYGRKLKVGRFDDLLQTSPAVQSIASDPTIRAIARGYLGCEPALLGARMWWSFASEADAAQQRSLGQGFHYDIDGYRALAFFFYLTDVTPLNGAHICVRGSHSEKPLKALVSLHKSRSDAEIAEWYGLERQMVLCGSAGDGFAEDIFCFHKGLHPEGGDRLILQVRFGLRNYDVKGD